MTLYFEDPSARAGFVNLAVRKGLWPSTQRFAAAYRAYAGARARAGRGVCEKGEDTKTIT